jgi:hypothetical protein
MAGRKVVYGSLYSIARRDLAAGGFALAVDYPVAAQPARIGPGFDCSQRVSRDNLDENRIASPEMLPTADPLPHSTCSRPVCSGGGAEMGRISMATRYELVGALAGRYAASDRKERGRILNEFVAVSGLHRKHAMRLLRAGQRGDRSDPRRARRLYRAGCEFQAPQKGLRLISVYAISFMP